MSPKQPFVRAVKSLTVAVWALAAAIFLHALPSILVYGSLQKQVFWQSEKVVDEINNFHELSIEEKIRRSSVIAITKYNRQEGKMSAVITSIPKRGPDVVFHYKVGDDYAQGARYTRPNVSYGDGEVVFFTGSPATMRLSMTYSNDRITGLGDIPMQQFLELVAKSD